MFAFRKNALYAFIAAGPFLVAACPGARGRAAGCARRALRSACCTSDRFTERCATRTPPPLPPAGSTEALSVPLQQLARAMVWEGKGLGAETFAAAESYVPAWRSYDERIADPLKFGSGNRRVEEDPAGFLSVWAQVGALRPAVYADAWLSLSHGFWYLGFRYSDFSQGRPYLEWRSVPREAISDGDADAFVYIGQTGPAALRETAGRFMDRMPWDSVPVLSWLFNPGLFAWVLIASATSCLYLRRYRLAAALALPLAYLATCLLGPTLLIRYAYPLFALAPFALGMPFVREAVRYNRAPSPARRAGFVGCVGRQRSEVMRFSIIIAAYNVERYIAECVESLRRQTFPGFEAIVIDDASTDGTLDEARRAAGGDERFLFLPLPANAGQSAARNAGLDRASGEVVLFLDSDDYYRDDALQTIASRMEADDLDQLYFSAETFYENRRLRRVRYEDQESRASIEGVMPGADLYVEFERTGAFRPSSCLYAVRRAIVEEAGLRFREGIIHEDLLFMMLLMPLPRRAAFENAPLYRRRMREGSTMTSAFSMRNVDGLFRVAQDLGAWLDGHAATTRRRFATRTPRACSTPATWLRAICSKFPRRTWSATAMRSTRATALTSTCACCTSIAP